MELELKPCPFCGSVDLNVEEDCLSSSAYFVMCMHCCSKGGESNIEYNAQLLWNNRVNK